MATRLRMFAGVAPGLESLLLREITALVPTTKWRTSNGGVEGLVSREEMWTIAHRSRLAELMRVRIGEFRADSFPELALRLQRLPWAAYLKRPSPPPVVSCTTHMSALYHTGAIAERVLMVLGQKGIVAGMPTEREVMKRDSRYAEPPPGYFSEGGERDMVIRKKRAAAEAAKAAAGEGDEAAKSEALGRPSPWEGVLDAPLTPEESPGASEGTGGRADAEGDAWDVGEGEGEGPPRLFVRLSRDVVTVSVDVSGPLLHKRGYRLFSGKAPMRETLAAAVVQSVHEHLVPDAAIDETLLDKFSLWDPLCGSGTLVIEAMSQALRIPSSHARDRPFGFEAWPVHKPLDYGTFVEGLAREGRGDASGIVAVGSDMDPKAVRGSQGNAKRAGLNTDVGCTFVRHTLGTRTQGGAGAAKKKGPHEVLEAGGKEVVVLGNLPYGDRLGIGTAKVAAASLEALLVANPSYRGYAVARIGLLERRRVTGAEGGQGGMGWATLKTFSNRGIPVGLFAFGPFVEPESHVDPPAEGRHAKVDGQNAKFDGQTRGHLDGQTRGRGGGGRGKRGVSSVGG